MTALGSPLRDARAAALVVGVVAGAVYANSLPNGFAFDDLHIVVSNTNIHALGTLPEALTRPYWPDAYGHELGLWRPVTTGLLGLLHVAGDGAPLVFHAANVLGHAAASILVLLLSAALMPLAAALAAGLVFAVHPVHVEAVANVVGLAEIASALALLAACFLHVRGPTRSGWREALAIGGLYSLAFGAKETGVTLPGLVLLIDAARRRIAPADLGAYVRDRWRLYLAMAVVAAALLAGRFAVLGSVADPVAPAGADLLEEIPRIWTLGEIWTHYVRLWVFPLDLAADYSPGVIRVSMSWHATNVVGAVTAIAILVATLVAWREPEMDPSRATARAAAFGVVWFVMTMSPVSNVFFVSGVLLAERTLYLASAGLAVATGWLVARLARERPRGAWAFLALALAAGSVRTWTRNPTWRDNTAFFNTLLRDVPHSGRAQWILGDEFLQGGNRSQALFAYRAAVGLLDSHYVVLTHVAQQLMNLGEDGPAETILLSAQRDAPQYALAPSLLAWIRAQHGDALGTERWARESLARYASDAARHHLLAWALAAQGRWEEARDARRRGDELGEARYWHRWVYEAYERRERGDAAGVGEALDSAWAAPATRASRRALDSIRVADFRLAPLLDTLASPAPPGGPGGAGGVPSGGVPIP